MMTNGVAASVTATATTAIPGRSRCRCRGSVLGVGAALCISRDSVPAWKLEVLNRPESTDCS